MGEIRVPRNMFLWSMAIVYMLAFSSLYVQIPGLYGNDGVSPVRVSEPAGLKGRPLLEQLWTSPSLVWLHASLGLGLDAPQVLELLCLLGALLALGAATLAPLRGSSIFLALWGLYFSLSQVGGDLLSSPWDSLLLEAGFLAVLVAPLNLLGCQMSSGRHDPMTFWLTRWLLFRLTFGSGVAKLAGQSAPWWNLSAVSHMLESQTSPTPLAWWAAQLPAWVLRLATVGVLVSQVMVPLLYFAPIRCLRITAFYFQLVHQLLSALTGNLTVLNLLTVALGLSLLDTEHTSSSFLGHGRKKRATKTWAQALVWGLTLLVELGVYVLMLYSAARLFQIDVDWEARTISSKTAFTQQQFGDVLRTTMGSTVWIAVLSLTWEVVGALLGSLCVKGFFWKLWAVVQWAVFAAATVAMFAVSVVPYTAMEPWSSSKVLPAVKRAHEWVRPYMLVSSYALERRLDPARGRPELVLEGSMDQDSWKEIQWMYKAGNVSAAPPVVAPYEARLDWQMWRAARGQAQESPWFSGLVLRLLQGNKNVERLLQTEPGQYAFSEAPPAYLRARLYQYQFTQQDKDGSVPKQWWRRDLVKDFCPAVYLGDPDLQAMLRRHGLHEGSPQPSPSDSLLARVLAHLRGHVQTLPGPYLTWALLATAATICVLKCMLSGGPGGRAGGTPPVEPKSKKAKSQAGPASKAPAAPAGPPAARAPAAERRPEVERSPRRRK